MANYKQGHETMKGLGTLAALTTAALSLPGIADAADGVQFDYRSSFYREQNIESDKLAGGSASRFDIDSHYFSAKAPIDDDSSVGVALNYETLSGASPWFVLPDANGAPVQVMTAATIEERRIEMSGNYTHRPTDIIEMDWSLGFSGEDDYRAVHAGYKASLTPNESDGRPGQTTWSLGGGISDDVLRPTEGASAAFPDRIAKARRDSWTAQGGVSQIFGRTTTGQFSALYTRQSGYLSDPYKEAFVDGNREQDNRPDDRRQYALMLRARQYFEKIRGALHLDYRFYEDDWNITAHTHEVSWLQRFGRAVRGTLGLRYYSQSQAYFYQPFYEQARNDALASSDYRLSPHAAISARMKFDWEVADWTFRAGIESYRSGTSFTLENTNVEHPGLVDFETYSFGITKQFGR